MTPPSFSLGPMTQRIAIIVGALVLSTTPLAAQPVPPNGETDGLLHAELTLNRQLVRVSLQPGLSADDGVAHREVLAGAAGAGLEIGTLEGHRALRLGTIVPIMETPSPASDEGEETEEEDAPPRHVDLRPFSRANRRRMGAGGDGHRPRAGAPYPTAAPHERTYCPESVRIAACHREAVRD